MVDYKEIRKDGNDRHIDDCPYRGGNLPELEGDWRDEEDRSSVDEDREGEDDDEDADEEDTDDDDVSEESEGEHIREHNRGVRRRLREWIEDR